MATDTSTIVDHLNDLLRGEISAAETYKMAIDKIADKDEYRSRVDMLHAMQRDHGTSAQRLRERIQSLGGDADNDSGMWGAWAKFTQGTSNLFGDKSALKALKEGEEHGLKDFERTTREDDLDPTTQQMLNEMISQQRGHLTTLDRLTAMA